jgi:hypothetical protein
VIDPAFDQTVFFSEFPTRRRRERTAATPAASESADRMNDMMKMTRFMSTHTYITDALTRHVSPYGVVAYRRSRTQYY